jgi:hypothetical protein
MTGEFSVFSEMLLYQTAWNIEGSIIMFVSSAPAYSFVSVDYWLQASCHH